jgi:hypothetical protein
VLVYRFRRHGENHVIGLVKPDHQVQVAAGGVAGGADEAEQLAARHPLAGPDHVGLGVVVRRHHRVAIHPAVVQQEPAAVAHARHDLAHPTTRRCPDGRAAARAEVCPVVQLPDLQHGVEAHAERRGDRSGDRVGEPVPATRPGDPPRAQAGGRGRSRPRAVGGGPLDGMATVSRHQGDPSAGAHQQERVQVLRAGAQAPVQAGPRAVAAVGENAERLTGAHRLSGDHLGGDRFVGRPQTTGVDTHHAPSGHLAGEAHPAVQRRQHRVARARGEVHPAVAGAVPGERRGEGAQHPRGARQRPAAGRHEGGRSGGEGEGEQGQQDQGEGRPAERSA